MTALFAVLGTIALVDSVSIVPLCLVVLSVVLAGARPYRGAGAFLAGIFLSYVVIGVVLLVGLDAVFAPLDAYLTRLWRRPQPAEVVVSIAIGLVLIGIAVRMARKPPAPRNGGVGAAMTPARVFALAVGLNVLGLPGAVPYFAAIDQILRADLALAGMTVAVAFYSAVFVLPLAAIVALRAALGARAEPLLAALGRVFDSWGRRAIVALIFALGAVLVADGIGWLLGRPLIPV